MRSRGIVITLIVVLLALSMAGLMIALKTLPVGPAYAVWVGIGAVVTAIVGMIAFDDPLPRDVVPGAAHHHRQLAAGAAPPALFPK